MKKMFLVMAMVLIASAAFGYVSVTYGTWITTTAQAASETITNTAATTSTAGNIIEIIAADDGNTAISRAINIWDSLGNTIFTKTYAVGQILPAALLPSQLIGPIGTNPVNVIHSGIPYTGNLYIGTAAKIKILKK